jgi:hypothetical protein
MRRRHKEECEGGSEHLMGCRSGGHWLKLKTHSLSQVLAWEQIRKETSTYARELLWKKTFDRRNGHSMDGMLRKV